MDSSTPIRMISSVDGPPMLIPEEGPSEPVPILHQPDPQWEKNRRNNNPLLDGDICTQIQPTSVETTELSHSQSGPKLSGITLQVGANKIRLKLVHDPVKARLRNMIPPSSTDDEVLSDPLACNLCNSSFTNTMALQKHMASHSQHRPFVCAYCGKTATNRQSLMMHERIHTGEKPFQCPICTKCFARQNNYNIHMKLHASGKRHFCQFCGKWFRDESQMRSHEMACGSCDSVVAEKALRYACTFCDKLFHHRRDKHIHERTHTGERPYTCGYCDKGFTQSQALTIHIRTHTNERPYSCSVCSQEFRGSSALRKHEFLRHSNIDTSTYSGNIAPPMLATQPTVISVDANTFFM